MSDTLHSWITTLLSLPVWAGGAIAAFVIGLAGPWVAEFVIPQDMDDKRSRAMIYLVAILLGPLACVSIWHTWAAPTVGLAASLAAQIAREYCARRWPILSPRQQVIIRRDAQGNITGIKDGDDPTMMITRPEDKH